MKHAKTLIGLLVTCLLVLLMFRWFEHSQVYHPDRALTATGAELGRAFEDVQFQTSDGIRLNGWFFPANTNSSRARLSMLLCHGNAGNIGHRLDTAAALLATGVNVFVFDYRGYGRSQGRPGEEGTYLDAQAAHRWLCQRGFSGTNIIAFGESLGGGIATELAMREPVGGLVLQSTFTSIPDIGAELFPWLPVRWLATIRYDTHSKLPRLKVPVLVMHSRMDEIVPFHHGERNFAAANEPRLFWELRGDHNNPLADMTHFRTGLEEFLALIEAGATMGAKPF
ncbi:MAG TPA: alpha/beta hydrolase [Candidatus Paceibacterota bacterium]|nr:alpha/beta hydrolase [Verrucomicrobiota bacterium]HSA09677.1 alpha/beta hydrolase [Candidatus Paceibacterota bacterium]